jgi:hypothetical protein
MLLALVLPASSAEGADSSDSGKRAPATGSPSGTGCGESWNLVPVQTPATQLSALADIAAVDENNVWAVGRTFYPMKSFIEHWDGSNWSEVASPGLGPLNGVSTLSANDIWAAGTKESTSGDSGYKTLIQHWNGTEWSLVPSPNPGFFYNFLNDIYAVAANDVWAVGASQITNTDDVLVLHWDGANWNQVPAPGHGANPNYEYERLDAIWAAAPNAVWAGGSYYDSSVVRSQMHLLFWNGTEWTVKLSPDVEPDQVGSGSISGIHGTGPNDVWVVGSTILHWDGSSWTEYPTPDNYVLDEVWARATDDVWVVGTAGFYNEDDDSGADTLVLHWDGTNWSRMASPNHSTWDGSYLMGIVALSDGNVWAVGQAGYSPSGSQGELLIAQYYDPCTGSCSIQFQDMDPDSPFYPYVQCLACRNILSGFPDGTFRPNSPVTRGQIAKIVANAAGFGGTPNYQTFEDVQPGSTYYTVTERLAARHAISGYQCGTIPGETCGPRNRKYFRTNAPASRGQIAKIVAIAADLRNPAGEQIYEDVPPGSTFYLYIQQLSALSVMGGYACGAPDEPCSPPHNLPYFRPNRDTTRGQLAKIVANTFYPGCHQAAPTHK